MTRRLAASHLRPAWPALAGYLATRALILAGAWLWATHRHLRLADRLSNYDGIWYARIAAHGYDHGHGQSDLAFFPAWPALIRATGWTTTLGYRYAGILVAAVAGLAAAWGLYALGAHLYGQRAGVMLVLVWGLVPWSVVESMAYPEALFTALAAWALWALLTRRWLTAALLTLAAGLTRPTAWTLIAVVGVAAIVAIVRREDGWRPYVTLLVAPAGWVGYLAWVAGRTGRLDGWLRIQRAWGTRFDGGRDTLRSTIKIAIEGSDVRVLGVMLVLIATLTLMALSILDRQPWPLLAYSALTLVTTLGAAGYYQSKARFLLPAVALLLPVARGLARSGTARAVVVLSALALVAVWWGGYLLLVSPVSP